MRKYLNLFVAASLMLGVSPAPVLASGATASISATVAAAAVAADMDMDMDGVLDSVDSTVTPLPNMDMDMDGIKDSVDSSVTPNPAMDMDMDGIADLGDPVLTAMPSMVPDVDMDSRPDTTDPLIRGDMDMDGIADSVDTEMTPMIHEPTTPPSGGSTTPTPSVDPTMPGMPSTPSTMAPMPGGMMDDDMMMPMPSSPSTMAPMPGMGMMEHMPGMDMDMDGIADSMDPMVATMPRMDMDMDGIMDYMDRAMNFMPMDMDMDGIMDSMDPVMNPMPEMGMMMDMDMDGIVDALDPMTMPDMDMDGIMDGMDPTMTAMPMMRMGEHMMSMPGMDMDMMMPMMDMGMAPMPSTGSTMAPMPGGGMMDDDMMMPMPMPSTPPAPMPGMPSTNPPMAPMPGMPSTSTTMAPMPGGTTTPDPHDHSGGSGTANVMRMSGRTTYATAVMSSKEIHADGSAEYAVITNGAVLSDSLSAASLAGAVEGPVLLSSKEYVPAVTLAELERLGVRRVFVVGGTATVSGDVITQLREEGYSVTRVGGTNRYNTAAAVALRVMEITGEQPTKAIIVNGNNTWDAIAASPYAAANNIPMLFTSNTGVPSITSSTLRRLGVDSVVVIGSTSTVSRTTYNTVARITALSDSRISGSSRFELAKSLSEYSTKVGWATPGTVMLANGTTSPTNALIAGAAAGANGGVLLYVTRDTVPMPTKDFISMHKADSHVHTMMVVGSSASVSDLAVTRLASPSGM